jgi:hypothetical protein
MVPPDPRSRKRRFRRRQCNGQIVLRVEVSEHNLAQALISAGRLSPDQALCRHELEQATERVISDFVARWGTRPFP